MFNNEVEYNEQMKNIAVSSSNKPLMEAIISCFVRKMILLISYLKYILIFFYRKQIIIIIIIYTKIHIEVQ
jgi:hypothetical protein